jgi:GntR family transcriptional regulator/MocR family aminotransferase
MRALYGERRAALVDSLRSELGPKVRISGAQAGTHLSLILNGIEDAKFVERAAKRNLWLVPLSPSYLGKAVQQGFVLGFGSVATEAIPAAVRKLGLVLNSR